jgi:DNA-directed RNA polymerase II subunit RPB2
MVCPAETPEGQACGLVKNLSLMAFVSVGSAAKVMTEILLDFGVEELSTLDPKLLQKKDLVKIFVNGNWIGCHRDASELVAKIKEMRRKKLLRQEISIVHDIRTKEIKFLTDSGRVQRPLFIIEKNKLRI